MGDTREKSERVSGIRGKKAFVLGGTGGIGRELARALYGMEANVIIHGRSMGRVEACRDAFRRDFPESRASVLGLIAELGPDSWEDFVYSALKDFLPVDMLVLSFGPFVQKPLSETPPSDWRDMAALNLALPGAIVSACLPGMLKAGFGRILLLGGTRTSEIRGFSSNAAYAAAKTGLNVIAKSVAKIGSERNVSCVVACPGFVDTEYLSPDTRQRLASLSPAGLLPARAFAQRALALALDGRKENNGMALPLDGGLELG